MVNNIQKIRFAVLDKTFKKQRAQPCCCSKLASNHPAQLSFCFKEARIVRKVKLVWNTVRNCPVSGNWRQNALRNCLFLENGPFSLKAKICPRHRAQHSCCSKLASKLSAKLSLCLKLVSFVKRLKLVQNPFRNFPVAANWRQNALHNSGFVQNWRLLLRSWNLTQTPCATVLLLEIGLKTLCATVVSF